MDSNIRWLIISMAVTFYVSYLMFNFGFVLVTPMDIQMKPLTASQEKQMLQDYSKKINQ